MKPVGQFFLWPGFALYAGSGMDSTMHQHYMIQVGFSLELPLDIGTIETPSTATHGFIVSKNIPHRVGAAGVASVFIWIDPDSYRGWQLRQTLVEQQTDIVLLDASVLPRTIRYPLDCCLALTLRETILDTFAPLQEQVLAPDDRVAHIMRLIDDPDYLCDLTSIDKLAQSVHLSPGWARHLFRTHVGLSLQQYILWQRVRQAMECMSTGASITEAAYAAGFADSAHLSRAFRNSFGLAPSDVFRSAVQVVLCT